ncbi:hypothetical protein AB0C12_30065 [Actinoplanes sp. NPDC048967]|uniref:hypothetical protein n=1 Tax=Actinoplanes sp. NPDC048967 TaxID=3155269 RepID=UPI0034049CF7
MATVARLLPRYWDGRRLLQFLAGLALIALAFALPSVLSPAEAPAESPVTIITTVDTPAGPAVPLVEVPAPRLGGSRAGLALSAPEAASDATGTAQVALAAETALAAEIVRTAEAAEAAATGPSDAPASGPVDAGAVQGVAGLPVQPRHDGRGICVEARAAAAGATPRPHGQRGPPRA